MSRTMRDMKLATLEVLSKQGTKNIVNLIGKPYSRGDLERHMDVSFDPDERNLAEGAIGQLRASKWIRATYEDMRHPQDVVEITDVGRVALEHGASDQLDLALEKIGPQLVEMRAGARTAIASGQPDSIRQAAHSAREMIDQVLKEGAPDSQVRSHESFASHKGEGDAVVRRDRLRYLMSARRGISSESELEVAEKAYAYVLALDDQLTAASHSRAIPDVGSVTESLEAVEALLRRLLVST